jgi:hypothetical protein
MWSKNMSLRNDEKGEEEEVAEVPMPNKLPISSDLFTL